MKPAIGIILVTLCYLTGCSGPQPSKEVERIGLFEPAPCPVEIPGAIEGESVNCGYVEVPEFHDRPSERTLRLAVAVFPR
jgi:hypothetical protein